MVTEKQEVGKVAKEESAGSDTDKSDSAGEATDAEVYSKIREEKARIWTVNKSLSIRGCPYIT